MVYIADGYCNSRIVVFSGAGEYLGEMGQQGMFKNFYFRFRF